MSGKIQTEVRWIPKSQPPNVWLYASPIDVSSGDLIDVHGLLDGEWVINARTQCLK